MNTDAEQQVSKGVDEDNSPRTGKFMMLLSGLEMHVEMMAHRSVPAHYEQGCGKAKS